MWRIKQIMEFSVKALGISDGEFWLWYGQPYLLVRGKINE